MKRVGIYAGTFDPIHNGHIAFAESALKNGLDKVYFLVEPRPRRKQGVRALEHRVAMAELVASTNPKLGVIRLEQARFTPQETLPLLMARFKGQELVMLFGDDVIKHMVDNLGAWPHIEDLAQNTSLLVGARHHQIANLSQSLKSLRKYGLVFNYTFVEPGEISISSSNARTLLRRGQTSPDVPPLVQEYIKKHKIYTSSSSTK